ncbi:MAG: S9 family peptidase [Planctomycetota bacterium]|jgi:dipeptidyl aminopeptidase/acylaminoacyl peptidase
MKPAIPLVLLLLSTATTAQDTYREPPAEILRVLDAPPLPYVSVSPNGDLLLLLERENLPPIAEMARPMLRLAGTRVDPDKNAAHGPRSIVGIRIKSVSDAADVPGRQVGLPDGAGVGFPDWSPDGTRFLFTLTFSDGVELWICDAATGTPRKLTDRNVNTLGVSPTWMPDGRTLRVGLLPEVRVPRPVASDVPTGPVIQETLGGKAAPVRTYQDLLTDAHDEALFEYHFTSQLVLIDSDTGESRTLGEPAVIVNADPSPDGRYFLLERVIRPYSYLVPWYRFPQVVEIWDADGRSVTEIARLPLADRIPIQGVITGPRSHQWRDTEGTAQLWWVEALDEGDPDNEVDHRDRLLALSAPFDSAPTEVLRTQHRFSGLSWMHRSSFGLVTEYDRDERWVRSWLMDPDATSGTLAGERRVVFDRSVQDRYGHPGTPITRSNAAGRGVVMLHAGAIYLSGRGASPDGDRPFLDRMDLTTLETTRLWRNEGAEYESVADVIDRDGSAALAFVTRRETPTEPPNYFLRRVGEDGRRALTAFEHPAPELLGISKELVTYERDDGVSLSATLYLPAGHQEGEQLPLLVWAYPREFNDPAMAGQVSGSPHRFTMFGGSSHLFMLTQGYAILDGATMPVVGADPETVNDTFLDQIVASARAAIDKAVAMGVADGEHVGVGGHSYGAFMTANLLAHSDLFDAGIARSGAYNRSLTPFGFQGERRTFWEASDVYFSLSPFMHADAIDEPLLMIHGAEDNNSGTFPIQSERMYHAIKGHGGVARLVMLPEESHGYRARESVLHTLAEMVDWLDRWVKREPAAE